MTYPTPCARRAPSLTEDLMLWLGPLSPNLCILCLKSQSPWRETVWEENMAGRGLFPACFAAQSRAPCHISSFLGHREDLQSSFCPGREVFFCPIPRKEVRPHAHFVREKVCFPSRTAAPSRPSVFGFLIGSWRGRRWQQLTRLPSPGDGHCTALSALAVHVSQSSRRAFLCGRHCFPLIS